MEVGSIVKVGGRKLFEVVEMLSNKRVRLNGGAVVRIAGIQPASDSEAAHYRRMSRERSRSLDRAVRRDILKLDALLQQIAPGGERLTDIPGVQELFRNGRK
jgi:hypothetical protein